MKSWIPSLLNPSADGDDPSSPGKTIPRSPSAGVKEDLTAVFRGVASFLAPPPSAQSSGSSHSSSSDPIAGIKNDLAEIQGSFKSGLSLISSKLTSNFLQFQNQENDDEEEEEEEEGEEEEDIVGINEEILSFVKKISGRSELWTDFPISVAEDFDMSDYQREHAANIDHLVPELVTLRKKICNQIREEKFWLIYFVLLFPRLNDEDLELLSTPRVVETRETLLNRLHNKTGAAPETDETPNSSDANKDNVTGAVETSSEHKDLCSESEEQNKNTETINETESVHHSRGVDDTRTSVGVQNLSENEEDVSFSDLEDDNDDVSKRNNVSQNEGVRITETSGAQGSGKKIDKIDQSAPRHNRSEGEESNDWQTVDDIDFDNLAEL